MSAASDDMKINIDDYIFTQETPTVVKMPYNVFMVFREQKISNAQAWLKDWLVHKPKCMLQNPVEGVKPKCSCGLREALERRF